MSESGDRYLKDVMALATAGAACRVVVKQMDEDGLTAIEAAKLARWAIRVVAGDTELPGDVYAALRLVEQHADDGAADAAHLRAGLLMLAECFDEMADDVQSRRAPLAE